MLPADGTPRDDPLRSVQLALANPGKSAVLVVGPPGSGKSHLLDRVANCELQQPNRTGRAAGAPRVFLRPTHGTRDPSLAVLLGGDEPLLPAVVEPARPGRPGRRPGDDGAAPPLLVVDDLDLLDASSLTMLSQALDRELVRLAGAVRTRRAPAVFAQLRPVRPLALVTLPPWSRCDLLAYASQLLGGALHELTVHRLLSFSGGSPLCLSELLDRGLATDRLRARHGVWSWEGPLDVPPLTAARLGDHLGELDDDVLDLLTTVALLEDADLKLLEAVHGAAVERADEHGLLDVRQEDGALRARTRPVLLGPVVLQRTSSTRRRRLARQLLDLLEQPGQLTGDPAALARLSTLSSVPLRPHSRLTAARAAVRQHRHDAALAVLEGEPEERPAEAAALRAAVLVEGARFEAAADALDAAVRSGRLGDDEADELLTQRAGTLCLATGDRAGWERWTRAARPGTPWSASWTWTVRAWHAEALDDVEDGAAAQPAPEVGSLAHAERAFVARVASRAQAGDVRATAVTASGAAPREPVSRLHLLVIAGCCQLATGAVGDAERLASEAEVLAVGWPYAYGCAALLAGLCALARGHPDRAIVRLGEALICLEDTAAVVLRRYGLAQLALAHVMAGRRPDAELALLDADRAESRLPRALEELTQLSRAEVQLALGAPAAAAEQARGVAVRCAQPTTALVELLALHALARARPEAAVTRRLHELAAQLELPIARTFAQHALAAEQGDAARLTDLAVSYDRTGRHWLAGETAARALTTRSTRSGSWVPAARQVLHRLEAHPDVRLPASWFGRGGELTRLTERERQIAELVSSGRSTPLIAEQLHLSQRTVENHLQHAYRKLGVRRRQELAVLLSASERPLPVPRPTDDRRSGAQPSWGLAAT